MYQITKIEIEKETSHRLKDFTKLSEAVIEQGLDRTKLLCAIYFPELLIGQGGLHIWFKLRNDKDTRIAITYLKIKK